MSATEVRPGPAEGLHEARFWEPAPGGRVLCTLCPRRCRIPDGSAGFCFIRRNAGGRLVTAGYGRTAGMAVDPVEKKPLFHFRPGSKALSFGTAGCCLGCLFCQNWSTSKARSDDVASRPATPAEIVDAAVRTGCESIAYTYNEPTIFAEFVVDTARLARASGIKNILVTCGYTDPSARAELYECIDAANVDLKAFTEEFYRKATLSHLEPVLDTLRWIRRETDVWLEVTTLLIPGLNDSGDEIRAECDWFLRELGPDVPLHFTAFHPAYRMLDRPRTPPETLRRARRLALAKGLRFVYTGNIIDPEGQTTTCPGCGEAVAGRSLRNVNVFLDARGACPRCGRQVPGRW